MAPLPNKPSAGAQRRRRLQAPGTSGLVATVCVPLVVGGLAGCNWRKPLPRGGDAGPPVELVEGKAPTAPLGRTPAAGLLNTPSPVPLVDEHEPNDDRDGAQPIDPGNGVRGSLAPPTAMGAGKGADDWYAVTAPTAPGPQQLRLELIGSPQANLSMDLYDGSRAGPAASQPFGHIDEHGRGEPERVSLAVRPGQRLLVRVRGDVAAAVNPSEAAAYELRVTTSPAPPGSELEPNDTPEQATPALAADLSGTLPWRGDEDFWVLNVADALYRRPTPDGEQAAPPGLKSDGILRIELRTPGATPTLRLLLEPATTSATDGGAEPGGFKKLQFAIELTAPKGAQELRLRNVGLPAGTARAYIGVRAVSAPVSNAKNGAEGRYQLRLGVEPALEDAESEPNDECETANVPVLAAGAGGTAEGAIAGFLWPGDVDCFRLRTAGPPRRYTAQLALPGAGSDCRAALEWVRSDGAERVASPADGGTAGTTLVVRARGDALVRVSSREHKTCFDAPYRLLLRSEPDRP